MKIEIQEAYPIVRNGKKCGFSIHAYVTDFAMDLRGIVALKKPGKNTGWFIQLPHAKNVDEETGNVVKFPMIAFTNAETDSAFKSEIIKKSLEFISDKVANSKEEYFAVKAKKAQQKKQVNKSKQSTKSKQDLQSIKVFKTKEVK